ncbi:gamma-glutamyltransferase [Nitratireductor pacificus]|uniref:Glutathione hydrolase proenzyme n=1 Tax=Nitratireductor pacificus pht-3B TaxID=391937 RepID=K2MID4_9HYPH|nr:gamma-glutamyltransferase [Nitratireductor pacificus]EKF20470.1 gamma-glutamyltransferase [Nitratireductor pacificus pht-3B]
MVQRSEWQLAKSQVSSAEGIVATMYPQASEAGIAILRQGGNAVDAAVAAGFAVGVVEPLNSGLGGIAVMVYHEAATGRTYVIDGAGTLPGKTRQDQFKLATSGQPAGIYSWAEVENDANHTGHMSVAVPGMPACLCEALERWGTMPRSEIMAPAIHYAESGYLVDWYVSLAMAVNQQRLSQNPEAMHTFLREGRYCYRAPMLSNGSDVLRQPDLARTLREIAEGGADAFYRGRVAELIARDMEANGGLVTYDDMAGYRTRFSDGGIRGSYRGLEVIGGLENTGFPTVLEALNILEGFEMGALRPGSAEELHLVAEAQRRAFLDRFAHLADSNTVDVPLEGLISKEFAEARRAGIDLRRAAPHATAGDPWSHQEAGRRQELSGSVTGEGNTTHLTVIDKDRNMVSLLSTLGLQFGSCVVAKDTGVLLNNGTMWFDPVPGHVNSMVPGRRIMTAGSPMVFLRDGKPYITLGAPGGRRVISSLIHCTVNLVDHGMGPQQGLNTPRTHSEGAVTEVDSRVTADTVDALRDLGHEVLIREETFSSSYFGRPNGILIDERNVLQAGVNVLKPAMAIGL